MPIRFLTDEDKVLQYDTQTLTDEEKALARANIDANERTHWVENDYVEILPETTSRGYIEVDALIGLTAGKQYLVTWGGVEYLCSCVDVPVSENMTVPVLKNDVFQIYEFKGSDSDPTEAGSYFVQAEPSGVTFSICEYKGDVIHKLDGKFLPDGVPYVEGGGLVDILPECQPAYDETDNTFYIFEGVSAIPNVGDECVVNWNGTEYRCIAQDLSSMAPGVVGLGNGTPFGLPESTEPFSIVVGEEDGQKVCMAMPNDGTTELTISIQASGEVIHKLDGKFLPDGVPYVEGGGNVIIMSDATMTLDADMGAFLLPSTIGPIEAGKEYTVIWNGTEYKTTAIEFTEDGTTAVMFGDYYTASSGAVGTVATGEPFLGMYAPDEYAEAGASGALMPLSELTEVTVGIRYEGEVIHKLDPRCLPDGLPYIEGEGTRKEVLPETTFSGLKNVDDGGLQVNYIPLTADTTYFVNWNGTEYTCESLANEDGAVIGIGNASFLLGTGNNEPFGIISIHGSDYNNGEPLTLIFSNDGSTEATMSISKDGTVIHKIDERFIPADTNTTYTLTKSGSTITLVGSDGSETSVIDSDTVKSYSLGSFGVTASVSELNKLDGVTASTEELNKLDGVTASTEELNKLDGVTASTAELNKLHGVTASTVELNYLTGTTSSIQTQLDNKPGKKVNGETFDIDGTATVAGDGAEIFNDYTNNKATGVRSHSEGSNTTASGRISHSEGDKTAASGSFSHAEGQSTTASGQTSHAEGDYTTASGYASHAEGKNTIASGMYSHAEGWNTTASGQASHAEGWNTTASGINQHVQGRYNLIDSAYAHIVGNGNSETERSNAHTLSWRGNAWFRGIVKVGGTGEDDEAAKEVATVEYVNTKPGKIVAGQTFTIDGIEVTAGEDAEIFNWQLNEATGNYSHAEGNGTTASGNNSHAEGQTTTASGSCSHSEGSNTIASGNYSHSEGSNTIASGMHSHSEGQVTTASGDYSHSEGSWTTASGDYSHSEGGWTTANGNYQHVQGKHNIVDETSAHIVGNGTAEDTLSNAHTLDWNGNAWFAGDVYVGSTSGTNKDDGSVKLAKSSDLGFVRILNCASADGITYTATTEGITELTPGLTLVFVSSKTSASTTPTLNINGLGAKEIRRRLSHLSTTTQTGYSNNWLFANKPFLLMYNGTYWIVEGLTKPSAADLYGTPAAATKATQDGNGNVIADTYATKAEVAQLTSPSGYVFKITVSDDGTLSTVQV